MSLPRPDVSVTITTYNEAISIERLLESLVTQTLLPNEVVICDGGSTDDTVGIANTFAETSPVPIRVLDRPGANISQGRNAAIEAATGEIIAVTDAGVRLTPQWLEEITAPFEDPEVHAVAGFFELDPQTVFELALSATLFPRLDEIQPEGFAPSSRSVAFRRSAWAAVGGYPEWLDYSEDLVYDWKLKNHLIAGLPGPHPGKRDGGKSSFPFVSQAIVLYRPPADLWKHARTYFHYAKGDGQANLWWKRHLARYCTYLIGVPILLLASVQYLPWSLTLLILLLAGAYSYLRTSYRRLTGEWGHLSLTQKLQAALWVPIIRATGDLAKMAGYPVGLLWRWKHRHRAEIHWKKELSADLEPISAGPSRRFL